MSLVVTKKVLIVAVNSGLDLYLHGSIFDLSSFGSEPQKRYTLKDVCLFVKGFGGGGFCLREKSIAWG